MNRLERKRLREGLVDLVNQHDWQYYVTLNLNCASSLRALRTHFGRYCQYCDRQLLGPRYLKRSNRPLLIAFPEHVTTNAHLHCLANLQLPNSREVTFEEYNQLAHCCWKKEIACGTTHVRPVDDAAAATLYSIKNGESGWNLEHFMLSTEFHP